MEGTYYHGATQLGVGEHDSIKKRLDEERQGECRDYMETKEMARALKETEDEDRYYAYSHRSRSPTPEAERSYEGVSGGADDIGHGTSTSHAHHTKELNDSRRAEYNIHMAAQSSPKKVVRSEGIDISTQTPTTEQQDGCTNTTPKASPEPKLSEHRQRQQDYGDALRAQIAEKKFIKEQNKRREDAEDVVNAEMMNRGHQWSH